MPPQLTVTKEDLQRIFRFLTLQSRPRNKWPLWFERGLKKIDANPQRFINYWTARLSKGDPTDLALYNNLVWSERAKEKLVPSPPIPPPPIPPLPVHPPPLVTQAKTLASSMTSWAASGFKTVSKETLKSRLDTCSTCPLWDPTAFGGTGRCTKCGCSTQAKLRLAHEKCPEGKWGPE